MSTRSQVVFSNVKLCHIWLICWVRQYRVTLLSPLLWRAFIWLKISHCSLPLFQAWRFDKFSNIYLKSKIYQWIKKNSTYSNEAFFFNNFTYFTFSFKLASVYITEQLSSDFWAKQTSKLVGSCRASSKDQNDFENRNCIF